MGFGLCAKNYKNLLKNAYSKNLAQNKRISLVLSRVEISRKDSKNLVPLSLCGKTNAPNLYST